MPVSRETPVFFGGPINNREYQLSLHEGDEGALLFRAYEFGGKRFADLSDAVAIGMLSRQALGVTYPTLLASPAHPLADWSKGLVAVPYAAANLTNRAALVSTTLRIASPATSVVFGRGYVEILDTPGIQSGDFDFPGADTTGTTGNRFEQCFTNEAVWTVEHNLGGFPSVVVLDTSGDFVIGSVEYVDTNNLTITFLIPLTGCVYLN